MYVLGAKREKLLDCLPKGGRVAEIGVALGDFSAAIYDQAQPMELHLIDPWTFQDDEDYKLDDSNVPQAEADRRYQSVCERFAPQIEAQVIQVHRDFSENAADQFPDEHFDWVYIDANHTYEACIDDLRRYAPKVKSNGFICGHDFANHSGAQQMKFGVVEAVHQFVRETDYEFTLLTYELYPTYVIAKSIDHELYDRVFANALVHCGIMTEIENPAKQNYQQKLIKLNDGSMRFFYSFS